MLLNKGKDIFIVFIPRDFFELIFPVFSGHFLLAMNHGEIEKTENVTELFSI